MHGLLCSAVHVLVTGLTSFTGFGVCCDQARHYKQGLSLSQAVKKKSLSISGARPTLTLKKHTHIRTRATFTQVQPLAFLEGVHAGIINFGGDIIFTEWK